MNSCNQLRAEILKAVHQTGIGLMPSAFSILEILYTLDHGMGPDDELVLSKGHGILAQYAVRGQLAEYAAGRLPVLGPLASLGHGLPQAIGLALNRKAGTVYCVVGDGECQEGSIWEAIRVIGERALPVVVIVDANRSHSAQAAEYLFAWAGFLVKYINGHSMDDLKEIFEHKGPFCFIAVTHKGFPFLRMMDEPGAWHNRAPDETELQGLLDELECVDG